MLHCPRGQQLYGSCPTFMRVKLFKSKQIAVILFFLESKRQTHWWVLSIHPHTLCNFFFHIFFHMYIYDHGYCKPQSLIFIMTNSQILSTSDIMPRVISRRQGSTEYKEIFLLERIKSLKLCSLLSTSVSGNMFN